MSSKVIPKDDNTPNHRAFVYRSIGEVPAAHLRAHEGPLSPVRRTEDESNQRLARIQELEAALPGQLAMARDAGFREGEERGRQLGQQAVQTTLDRLAGCIQDLIATKPRLRREVEEEAVQLSLAIARRALHREISIDPSSLQALVHIAYERVGRQEIQRIIVHPEQEAAIRTALGQLTTRKLEIVADPNRESGTLIFECVRGDVDASIDSQLNEIELGLTDRLRKTVR